VRKVFVALSLAALVSASAAAQSWHTALGIQSGYSRVDLAGTNTPPFDVYGIPQGSLINVIPSIGSLFAILPVGDKLALEPSLGFQQVTASTAVGLPPTEFIFGLRANYALTPNIYGAVGGTVDYFESGASGIRGAQLGVQAAVGYRMHLLGQLDGRIEANVIAKKKTNNIPPIDVYSLLLGVSTRVGGGAGRAAGRSTGAWEPVLGISGGYAHIHQNQGIDLAVLTLPNMGSDGVVGGTVAPTPPSLFVILPAAEKIAVEIGFDIHDLTGNGTSIFTAQFDPRIDYAFSNHWYGAVGPNLHLLRIAGGISKTIGIAGVGVAGGYRFRLAGGLGGRLEASYSVDSKRRNLVPANVLGMTIGATMALK